MRQGPVTRFVGTVIVVMVANHCRLCQRKACARFSTIFWAEYDKLHQEVNSTVRAALGALRHTNEKHCLEILNEESSRNLQTDRCVAVGIEDLANTALA